MNDWEKNYDLWKLSTPDHYDDNTVVDQLDMEFFGDEDSLDKFMQELEDKARELADKHGITIE